MKLKMQTWEQDQSDYSIASQKVQAEKIDEEFEQEKRKRARDDDLWERGGGR